MTAGNQQAARLTDPELRELAAQMPLVDFTREALSAIRTAIAAMLTSGENPSTDGVTFRERWIEREGRPALRLLHYCPDSSSDKLLPGTCRAQSWASSLEQRRNGAGLGPCL